MTKVKYFQGVKTVQDAKKVYFEYCKTMHPDKAKQNYNQPAWQEMQNQFKNFKPSQANHENGSAAKDNEFNREQFYNLVKNFDKLQGVKIEFVGSFIWLSDEEEKEPKQGATYLQKDIIKSIILEGMNGVRWHRTKKMWYYSPQGYRQFKKGTKSHDEVKKTWGSTEFNSSNRPKQTALNF